MYNVSVQSFIRYTIRVETVSSYEIIVKIPSHTHLRRKEKKIIWFLLVHLVTFFLFASFYDIVIAQNIWAFSGWISVFVENNTQLQ